MTKALWPLCYGWKLIWNPSSCLFKAIYSYIAFERRQWHYCWRAWGYFLHDSGFSQEGHITVIQTQKGKSAFSSKKMHFNQKKHFLTSRVMITSKIFCFCGKEILKLSHSLLIFSPVTAPKFLFKITGAELAQNSYYFIVPITQMIVILVER